MNNQLIRDPGGETPKIDAAEVLSREYTHSTLSPEEIQILISYHSNPNAMSFDELADIDDL